MTLISRFAVYSVVGTISLMSLLVLPALIGVLVDESPLSEAQAGMTVSIRFLGGAAIALLMAFRMHGMDLRKTAMLSFIFAALGEAVSGFITDLPTLFMTVQFVTGIASGAAYTVTLAAFARERHVDRGYGMFITLQFMVSGLSLYLLPVFSSALSVSGMYLALATLHLLGFGFGHWLPGRVGELANEKPVKSELSILMTRAAVFGALGFAFFELANTAQFTYVERFAVSMGLSDHELGLAMMVGSLAGIPGAFTIILIGNRFGRIGPLTLGMALAMVGLWVLIGAGQFSDYMTGSILLGFSWAFCLPFIQGLLASLDRHGSAVAAGSAASTIGGAMGPGLAAIILSKYSYSGVFSFAILFFLIALLSFFLTRSEPK